MTSNELEDIRSSIGLSLNEMAEAMGVSYQQYWAWENGAKKISQAVARLATVLGGFMQKRLIIDGKLAATVTQVWAGDGVSLKNRKAVWVAILYRSGHRYRSGESNTFVRCHKAQSWVGDELSNILKNCNSMAWVNSAVTSAA